MIATSAEIHGAPGLDDEDGVVGVIPSMDLLRIVEDWKES
jgi:hypothetical protein